MKLRLIAFGAAIACCTSPIFANSLVGVGPHAGIAQSKISAVADGEWNKLGGPRGKNVEIWTLDGDALNKVTFFGGIPVGNPLLRETDAKRHPLPRVADNMLITDIPVLLETTYRSQNAVNQMKIDLQEPASLDGHKGIHFTYAFTRSDDEVQRQGEAVGAMVNGQLYLVTYEAPTLYFFDKDVEKFRKLIATLKI